MTELEVVAPAEEQIETEKKSYFPDVANLVWDFAHATNVKIAPIEEECRLLRKTIRSSGVNRTLKLKSYEPSLFARIRAVSGVTDSEIADEWNPTLVAQNVASKGAGKSGALFIVSNTRRFLLKTLRKEEQATLKALVSDMATHFTDYPASFLSRQYALCKVEAQGSKQYFVIFNNLFSSPERTPTLKFDLKGARINRKSSANDLAKPGHVRMDLDETRTFPIDGDARSKVLEQINLDADLLAKHNVMDYSLLVGLVVKDDSAIEEEVKTSKTAKKKKKSKTKKEEAQDTKFPFEALWQTGLPSASNPSEHYMVGIIDILQDYNTFKKSAHLLKVIVYRTSSGLSTINAADYAERFKDYMESNVLVEHVPE